MSGAIGLVNGYFLGIGTGAIVRGATRTSDKVGVSAVDIERSLRWASFGRTRTCAIPAELEQQASGHHVWATATP